MIAAAAQGWTPSPNNRGTIDILWNCFVVIGLCCWTSICPNVPARREGRFARLCDRFKLACLSVLGPDFVWCAASGQLWSAYVSAQVRNPTQQAVTLTLVLI